MGHGASVPESEEEALAQGYTARQIEEYKVLVVGLARKNALRALELRNQQRDQNQCQHQTRDRTSVETKEETLQQETKE